MNLKKSFLIMILCMIFTSCSSPYGKKVKVTDHIEVYIKGNATEDEARKLGAYVDSTWKGATNNKSFQLLKDSGIYTVRMIVDPEKIKGDSSIDASFMAIQFLLEQDVFKGSKVKLIVTDDKFNDIKSF